MQNPTDSTCLFKGSGENISRTSSKVKDAKAIDELKMILDREQCSQRQINIFFEDLVEFMENREVQFNILSEEINVPQDDKSAFKRRKGHRGTAGRKDDGVIIPQESVMEATPEENVVEAVSTRIPLLQNCKTMLRFFMMMAPGI